MPVQLRSRLIILLAVFGMGLAPFVVLAKKPGGGGGDPPPPPPVLYALHRLVMPADYEGGIIYQEMNDVREVVGFYRDADIEGGEQPFYLDARTGNTVVTNMNEFQFEAGFGVPDGWYISRAHGINNLGDIAGSLDLYGDPDRTRGCVIELEPDPLDSSVKPRLHLIPDNGWSRTYARRINDVGVILGRGNSETAYVYRAPLHGLPGDDAVTVISTPFDSWSRGYLTNPVNGGPTLVKADLNFPISEILTYNVDSGTSSFSDVSILDNAAIRGFNDFGSFCGTYIRPKAKRNRGGRFGFLFNGVFETMDSMDFSTSLNNSEDVAGRTPGYRPVLDHQVHGSILIDDTIVAQNSEEQAIWDDSGIHNDLKATERNESGFPVLTGTMVRPDSPYSWTFKDCYVLFPIVP